MSVELSFGGAEYAKPVENKGKYKLRRVVFILSYLAFSGIYLYLTLGLTKMAPLIAVLPMLVYILYLATWRYCSFEWLIRINSGEVSICHLYNKKERKRLSFPARSVVSALPDTLENYKSLREGVRVRDLRTSPCEKEAYLILYEDKKGRTLVRVSVCRAVIVALARYSEGTVIDKSFLSI